MKFEDAINIIKEHANGYKQQFEVLYKDGTKVIQRIALFDKGIFQYAKGRRSYGYYLSQTTIETYWQSVRHVGLDKSAKRKNNLKTITKYLDNSGLWKGLNATFKVLLGMTNGEIENLIQDYNNIMTDIAKKCHGEYVGYDLFAALGDKSLKTINYFSWQKEERIACFEDAVKNKREYHAYWEKGYDNSLSIQIDESGEMRAFYSEEYRGCGNGHYYLALDARHALYCEDD